MSAPKVGAEFPKDTKFSYIPFTKDIEGFKTCGRPIDLNAGKEWADKKVVLFALPGAFTPTCSASHLPDFIAKRDELTKKGVDVVAVVAMNDPFVMSAWGKANNVNDDSILFLSDNGCAFSKQFGWVTPDGERTGRYAMIIDHGKITYAEKEEDMQIVTVSGVDAILKAL